MFGGWNSVFEIEQTTQLAELTKVSNEQRSRQRDQGDQNLHVTEEGGDAANTVPPMHDSKLQITKCSTPVAGRSLKPCIPARGGVMGNGHKRPITASGVYEQQVQGKPEARGS